MYHIDKEITGRGEEITLKDTADSYFKSIDIFGNSMQETREGYNLINLKDSTSNSFRVQRTIKDGIITLNGTPEGVSYNDEIFRTTITEEGTYTLLPFKSSTNNNIRLLYTVNSGGFSNSDTNSQISLKNGDVLSINLRIDSTNLISNFTLKPMLYLGTDEKPYEEYGKSPSIEYEAPISSVGDNINIFDKKNTTIEMGIISPDGAFSTSSTRVRVYNISVDPTTTYTISSSNKDLNVVPYFYTEDNTFISYNNGWKAMPYTFTVPSKCKILKLLFKNSTDNITVLDITDLKLEEGSKATGYSQYGQGSIDLKFENENLLNARYGVNIRGNDTYDIYNIKPNTKYTLYLKQKCITLGTSLLCQHWIAYKRIDGSIIKQNAICSFNWNNEGEERGVTSIITTPENCTSITLDLSPYVNYNVSSTIQHLEAMLCEGENESYVPYEEQNIVIPTQKPFRAVGDTRDKFVKLDGMLYEKHSIERLKLEGQSLYHAETDTDNLTQTRMYIILDKALTTVSPLSNRFKSYPTPTSLYRLDCKSGAIAFNNDNHLQIKVDYTLCGATFEQSTSEKTQKIKDYITENETIIDYVLAEPELIPCTPEQIKALDKLYKGAHSYEGTTYIFSDDEVPPIIEAVAYKGISNEFKERIKLGKITRGYIKVLANDLYPELIINENNYLKDLKIEELRYVPDEGFIGGTVAKRVTGNFNNVDSSFSIQDREIEVYLGIDLEDGTTEYIKYGTYIVQKPATDDQVNDNTSFEALDYMIKFNQPYEDRIKYPCTMKELLDDVADQAGVNSRVADFLNGDFIIENNQFEEGTPLRNVLKAIAQMAFNWARVDEENNLVMDFEVKDTSDETLTSDEYYNFKKSNDYGPVNVIVLRNSQVEGENVTIKDEESINEGKAEVELVISDNPFAYTQEKRLKLIEAGRSLFGLTYTPMTMNMIGFMYLNAKDRISATNLNNQTFYTYLLNHTIDYNGVVLDSMESSAKTLTETKYQFTPEMVETLRHTEILVDKANQRIEAIAKQIETITGNPVVKVELLYASSDSPTQAPTEGWSTTAPAWESGKYMWQKTVTTYADGTSSETDPTNITGATGQQGAPGQPGTPGKNGLGIKSIKDQYYLSTSNTTQEGGEWKYTQTPWEEGKYIWTRSEITWSDDSVTHTEPVLATNLNDINSNIVTVREKLVDQEINLEGVSTTVSDTVKNLNNNYLTKEQVNAQLGDAQKSIEILKQQQTTMQQTSSELKIQIDNINNYRC